MDSPVNLADPTVEPTDELLAGLMRRAFAGVAEARAASLQALYAEIASEGARRIRDSAAETDATLAAKAVSLRSMGEAGGRGR